MILDILTRARVMREKYYQLQNEWKISSIDKKKFSGGNSGKQKWGKIRQEEQVPYAS